MKAISRCPVCESEDLEQHFAHRHIPFKLGGEVTTYPSPLSGCSCNNCGVVLTFNKAGPCPNCGGTGLFEFDTYQGATRLYSCKSECPTCEGKGVIK